jgi:hypothetical protein
MIENGYLITVVCYTYLVNDWEEIFTKQLERTIKSGLYDECDEFYWIVCDEEKNKLDNVNNILKKYNKLKLKYITNNNFEYDAIDFIQNLSKEKIERKILYFHTKGVYNKFKNFNTKEINNLKVNSIKCWTNILEYYLIDRWKECIHLLNEKDIVLVTNYYDWPWGNFWWTKSNHINKNKPIKDYFNNRWDCESWLIASNNEKNNVTFYEFFHFTYDPYYSILPDYIFNEKINDIEFEIIEAKYGYFGEQTDEYSYLSDIDPYMETIIDVTDIVKNKTPKNNIFFNVDDLLELNFEINKLKTLRIKFKTNIDRVNEYIITSIIIINTINLLNK